MNDVFIAGSGGCSLPVGIYKVTFNGGEAYDEAQPDQWGHTAKYRLRFAVIAGDQVGQEPTVVCNRPAGSFGPKSSIAKWATAFKGGPIAIGEAFSFTNYVGTRGSIVVEATENGTRITTFMRDSPAAPAQQPVMPQPVPPAPPAAPQQAPTVPQVAPAQQAVPQQAPVVPQAPPPAVQTPAVQTPEQSQQEGVERF